MTIRKVIDISDYQEDINFDSIVAEGAQGVIIKISEGCSYTDNLWHFVGACKRLNLSFGFYCYAHATTEEQAKQEANEVVYLMSTMGITSTPPLGIWYDVEANEMFDSNVDTTAICSAFICAMNDMGFDRVGIYTSTLKCTDYMSNSIQPKALADYVPFWIADYRGYNGWIESYPDKHCSGWQYTDKGVIDGMNVDMNEWYDEF